MSQYSSIMSPRLVSEAGLSLHLRTNLFLGTRIIGEKILNFLVQEGGPFAPEFFDGGGRPEGRWLRFDAKDLSLPLEYWEKDRYSLVIIAKRNVPLKVFFHVSPRDFQMFDHVSLYFCFDNKGRMDSARARIFLAEVGIELLLDFAKKLHSIVEASWGSIRNDFEENEIGEILDEYGKVLSYNAPTGKARMALRGVFWANFFGPEYVEMFGRDNLLKAPCYRVEELSDGGMLLLLSETPFDASTENYKSRKKKLYSYLGEDAFNGKLLPQFRTGPGRKLRDARPLIEAGGVRDDVFH